MGYEKKSEAQNVVDRMAHVQTIVHPSSGYRGIIEELVQFLL